MCTAVAYNSKSFYFGRTLDFEFLYPCQAVFAPREYSFDFRFCGKNTSHYAMLGMAYVMNDYPLYFDGMNEKGLCMAGLNFVGNSVYNEYRGEKENIASFEFIPYILSNCSSVGEARRLLQNLNITNTSFCDGLSVSSLHWMISDKDESITVEAVRDGLRVYTNSVGVLTNNPPFEYQIKNLRRFSCLSPHSYESAKAGKVSFYTRGMGAVGLPGDYTSQGRFVRAAFVRSCSSQKQTEEESVTQFFHILNSVSVPEGACVTEKGEYDKTLYSACMSAEKGIYYYKPYESHSLFAVDMNREDKNSAQLVCFPFRKDENIRRLN